ncbi:sensor histidine kinase [Nocardia alni]|uniref:sensor histidine kinase n=1 Tax=Nocardia alni TaxID=2815723 RepID=UPI0027E0E09F|nr:nitrate- and nitrite sensing domain-containing protein [Nocardia alni]
MRLSLGSEKPSHGTDSPTGSDTAEPPPSGDAVETSPFGGVAALLRPKTIGGQLTRILAFALILTIALLTVTTVNEIGNYRESENTRAAVTLALNVQDLTDQVQREFGLSNALLGGDSRLQQPLLQQRRTVDATLGAVKDAADSNVQGVDRVRAALSRLGQLANTRAQIDTRRISRPAAAQFYNDAVDALNRPTLGLDLARDQQIQRGLQAFYALGTAKTQFAAERAFLNGVFTVGHFSGGEFGQFMQIRSAEQAALQSFSAYATTDWQGDLDAVMQGPDAAEVQQDESIALASGDGPLVQPVDAADWWTRMSRVIDAQRTVQQTVGTAVQSRADALRTSAVTTLTIFLVLAVLAIAAMIGLVLLSQRAIVRPLVRLASEAHDVAERRLPDAIDAWSHADDTHQPDAPARVHIDSETSAEITAVAGALDRVQSTAFELASKEALVRRNTTESMSNLARRNQNLVRRQLALLSQFERQELDPEGLSNLFELDHLATRMRRNAESLLILVGEGSPRRLSNAVPLTTVIRAGMSEVDDYRRVVLRRVDDVYIIGAVATELAHILAELIENGLTFSPPDMDVEMYGRPTGHGYVLAVVDHGVGMPPADLSQANAKLRGEQDFIVAPTRYLGHYVVGRLAQRLGIEVELTSSPDAGVVARLTLPSELLEGGHDRQPSIVQAKITNDGLVPYSASDWVSNGAGAASNGRITEPESASSTTHSPVTHGNSR